MPSKPGVLFFRAMTPIHVGAGSSLSHIDLPIQREAITDFPMVQSGSVKGALRAWCSEADLAGLGVKSDKEKWIEAVFGPKPDSAEAEKFPGALSVTDAKILLFPVASEPGVFSFVTCPMVLEELRQMLIAGSLLQEAPFNNIPQVGEDEILVTEAYMKKHDSVAHHWLLDLPFTVDKSNNLCMWMKSLAEVLGRLVFSTKSTRSIPGGNQGASQQPQQAGNQEEHFLRKHLRSYLTLVHDESFRDLAGDATEVRTRIQIDETGVVKDGALWTEEFLPTHSVLYSLIFCSEKVSPLIKDPVSAKNFFGTLSKVLSDPDGVKVTQFGGDQTLGSGWVQALCLDTESFPISPLLTQHQEGKEV